jgi:hypothetical protein
MNNKREYHYLVAGLPDLVIGQGKISLKVADFKEELRYFLHPDDFHQVEMLFFGFDNQNLIALLQKKDTPWNTLATFNPEQLEEGLNDPAVGLPSYMMVFYEAFKEGVPLVQGMSWENQLSQLYYDYVIVRSDGFLKNWFSFERDLKNILVAISARRYGHSPEGQLVGKNEVTEAIQKSHARDFGLSNEYPYLEKLLKTEELDDMLEREQTIAKIEWEQIDELNTFNYFTLDKILGFLLKLISFERWSNLDPVIGREVFSQKTRLLEYSFNFSQEYEI